MAINQNEKFGFCTHCGSRNILAPDGHFDSDTGKPIYRPVCPEIYSPNPVLAFFKYFFNLDHAAGYMG